MAKHIESLKINSYRGLRNLEIKQLGDINIFLGDNNCGKTSLLEALQILSNPGDFNEIVKVSRSRDRYRIDFRRNQSIFDSFLNIFDRKNDALKISMSCSNGEHTIDLEVEGEVVKEFVDISPDDSNYNDVQFSLFERSIDEEIDNFTGMLSFKKESKNNSNVKSEIIKLNKYSKLRISSKKFNEFNMHYLSTVDHIVANTFNQILKDDLFTKDVIELLKIFDENIYDLKIIPSEDGRVFQAICSTELGIMPVSSYGDGIKKVIAFANAILLAKNGLLLIDEIETAIHPKAMKKVYKFLMTACQKANVQLFVSTHSIETVDNLLSCGYENKEDIKVITLKKKNEKTFARVLNSKEASKLRFENDAELR